MLDAYPLPRIDDLVNHLAKYKIFSTLDLKSAYHQIKIPLEEKQYTAFEADGKLYQFCRVPFGVTNGVSAFQRVIDGIITEKKLKDTYAYLDNITNVGTTQEEHDKTLEKFMNAAERDNLTFNDKKTVISVKSICLLGNVISHGELKPDQERVKSLLDLNVPLDRKSLQRVMGMFSYYAQWVPQFSDKIKLLTQVK